MTALEAVAAAVPLSLLGAFAVLFIQDIRRVQTRSSRHNPRQGPPNGRNHLMYLQHTTSDPDGVMPVKVSYHPDDGKVVVRWGRFGDVYLSLLPAEAEWLRDGLSAALADRQAVAR